MIKAAIFDFDGTIANTLFDLQDSINEALKMNGFSREYTFEETKYLVGSGIRILCTRALSYKEHTLEQEEQVFSDFKKCYEISKDDVRNIKINGIFVSLLGNAIEEILEEYINNELPNIDCSGYIDEDIYWFSDKILEEVSE